MWDLIIKKRTQPVFFTLIALIALGVMATSLYAQETSGNFSGGSIKIGYDNRTCTISIDGALRYNSGDMEYCNGSDWITW